MKLKISFLVILVILITVGLLLPNGALAALQNNLWSLYFLKTVAEGETVDLQAFKPPAYHQHAGLLIAHQAMRRGEIDLAEEALIPLMNQKDGLVRNAQANLLYLKEDYAGAIDIWYALGDWHSLEWTSNASSEKIQLDDRIMAIEKAFALFPDRFVGKLSYLILIKANSLMEAQDYSSAIHILNDLLELSPGDDRPYAILAQAYYETGQFEQALETLQAGWDLNEENLDFYLTAGKLYEGMNLPDQALAAYQAALALDPQSSPAKEGIERLSVDPDA